MLKSAKSKKTLMLLAAFVAGMMLNRVVRQNVPGANRLPEA